MTWERPHEASPLSREWGLVLQAGFQWLYPCRPSRLDTPKSLFVFQSVLEQTVKIFDVVTYRESRPGSAVRMQVHVSPLWWPTFWMQMWKEVAKWMR